MTGETPSDGKKILIREAQPEDAEYLVAYMNHMAAEPNIHIVNTTGEFKLTPAQEAVFIQNIKNADNSVFMVADAAGEIVGTVLLRGGERKAERHTAVLGISVANGWRGRGIGGLLMGAVLEWAMESKILERIELSVFASNEAGIHLYEKFGFVVEGRRKKAIFRDGIYHDTYIMAFMLGANGF